MKTDLTKSESKKHYDNVPGTIHLVDLEGNLDVKKNNDDRNIILLPQPSSNPNDPLRWTQTKKIKQFALLWFWAFLLAVAVNFSGPLWEIWSVDFNVSFFQLNVTSALCFLFLGVGCLVLQPTALKLGRRFVYLLCTIIVLVSCVVGAQASNIVSLDINNILGGFAAAPVDSLVEISSTDVFFQHERASALAWLILALYAGSFLGPVACGYITQSMGWQWCFYFQVIIFGVLFIVLLFFMEDTTFRRDYNEETLEENILDQIKSRETVEVGSKEKEHHILANTKEVSSHSLSDDDASVDYSIPVRTYWQRMKIFELEYNDERSWLTIFYRPFFLVSFPAIIWGGILYGAQMMYLSLLSTSQSIIFSGAPYYFSANKVGLTNISCCVGSIIGMLYGGPFVDWLTIRLARRNNGVLEPEFRLYAMVVPTIVNAAGLLAYGLGASYGAHWAVPAIIGQGLLGVAMSSSGAICLSYAVDSYQKVASEGLVLMLFLRNCIGMGFTFGFQPWLDHNGLKVLTWLLFMLSIVINGSFIFMIKYGKTFRRWTKSSYEKYSDPYYGELFRKKT
ncbi:putative ion transporter [Scheffersomyces coipomensis]|uniref:putative ion transporter n=1 Tax=Scheffersomyces coipomensis TaxID=1788519 RepID=UPI00315D063B